MTIPINPQLGRPAVSLGSRMIVTKTGPEIVVWVKGEANAMVPLGSAANLPDAKLAARRQFTRLQAGLDRLSLADVEDV